MAFQFAIPSGYAALGGRWDTASQPAQVTLSNGNTTVSTDNTFPNDYSYTPNIRNLTALTGKHYFETKVTVNPNTTPYAIGFAQNSFINTDEIGFISPSAGYFFQTPGKLFINGSQTDSGIDPISGIYPVPGGPVIGWCIDWPNRRFCLQTATGVFSGSGSAAANPTTGTNCFSVSTLSAGTYYVFAGVFFRNFTVNNAFSGTNPNTTFPMFGLI